MNVESFLNYLLDELGQEQDAEVWATDVLRPCAEGHGYWWTANDPGTGRFIEVYIHHLSESGSGYTLGSFAY